MGIGIRHTWSYGGYEFRIWDDGKGDGIQFDGTGVPEFAMRVYAAKILALAKESEIQKARIAELETENAKLRAGAQNERQRVVDHLDKLATVSCRPGSHAAEVIAGCIQEVQSMTNREPV